MHWTIAQLAAASDVPKDDLKTLLETNWTIDLLAIAADLNNRYVRSLLSKKTIKGIKVGGVWTITRANGDAWLASRGITVED